MRNEKKYELTLSDLQVYIGIASFEALPKDATPEVEDMYNTVAARIYDKIAKHLDGSDPFPTDKLIYAKKINNFVDELGEACEQILRAVME